MKDDVELYKVKSITRIQINVEERFPGRIYINEEMITILKVETGSTLFFLADEKGNIYIKNRYIPGEELLEKSTLRSTIRDRRIFNFTIPRIVTHRLGLTIGDQILLILDKNNNVIIRDAFLIGICAKDVIKKRRNIGARIVGLSTISPNLETTIPIEIREIFSIDDIDEINIYIDRYSNIVISTTHIEDIRIGTFKIFQGRRIYLPRIVTGILDVKIGDEILWIIDEDENIIMRNSFLPDVCFQKI